MAIKSVLSLFLIIPRQLVIVLSLVSANLNLTRLHFVKVKGRGGQTLTKCSNNSLKLSMVGFVMLINVN